MKTLCSDPKDNIFEQTNFVYKQDIVFVVGTIQLYKYKSILVKSQESRLANMAFELL